MFGPTITTPGRLAGPVTHDERPAVVFWETTKACGLACVHCRATARRRPMPGELTHREGLALLQAIADFGDPAPRLVLTGGDPLERPDLVPLIEAARDLHVPVAVAPAATPRLTPDVLATLRTAGADGVSVSLDHVEPDAHDAFRRSGGSFARASEAIREARRLGYWTQVNTVAHGNNLDALPGLFAHLRALGAHAWEVIPLIPVGRAAHLTSLDAPTTEALLHHLIDAAGYGVRVHAAETPALRRVARERANGSAPPDHPVYRALRQDLVARLGEPGTFDGRLGTARAGAGVAFVAADGTVMPSGFVPIPCGNVRDAPLARIYREHSLFRALRAPRAFTGPCGPCAHGDHCGGSRARALAATGDVLGSDPTCPIVARRIPVRV